MFLKMKNKYELYIMKHLKKFNERLIEYCKIRYLCKKYSIKNYNAYKKAGFENVYFCELQESDHNNISKTDEEKMSQVLHSFYKKHDFQHDPKKATIINFQPLQPTVEEIDKKLHANLWELRKQSMINATVVASVVAIGLTIKYTSKK